MTGRNIGQYCNVDSYLRSYPKRGLFTFQCPIPGKVMWPGILCPKGEGLLLTCWRQVTSYLLFQGRKLLTCWGHVSSYFLFQKSRITRLLRPCDQLSPVPKEEDYSPVEATWPAISCPKGEGLLACWGHVTTYILSQRRSITRQLRPREQLFTLLRRTIHLLRSREQLYFCPKEEDY
jgi:hypothetical protein